MRRIQLFFPTMVFLVFQACSDGGRTPLDLDPNDPELSGTEIILDFEGFAAGDTITESNGVAINLLRAGAACADAVIAFDSGVPHGDGDDDLDLGTPNEAFGGPGVGAGGVSGAFQNDKPLGNLLVIQEDPTHSDGSPDPQDDCQDGGTIAFEFSSLSVRGVVLTAITVVDVDDQELSDGTVFRLFGPGDKLLSVLHPPVTGQNGVASMSLGPTADVVRLEIEMVKSVAVDRVAFSVPEDTN